MKKRRKKHHFLNILKNILDKLEDKNSIELNIYFCHSIIVSGLYMYFNFGLSLKEIMYSNI